MAGMPTQNPRSRSREPKIILLASTASTVAVGIEGHAGPNVLDFRPITWRAKQARKSQLQSLQCRFRTQSYNSASNSAISAAGFETTSRPLWIHHVKPACAPSGDNGADE